jgi:hypothetical protein
MVTKSERNRLEIFLVTMTSRSMIGYCHRWVAGVEGT